MTLSANSLARAVGAKFNNVGFQASSQNLSHLIGVVGTYDPAITTIDDEVGVFVTSPEDAANRFGYGFMIHRLVRATSKGAKGVPIVVIPQAEAGGAVQAAGLLDFQNALMTASGTLYLYIGTDAVPVALAKGDDDAAIVVKVVAAITANPDLPVEAAVNGTNDYQADITVKSAGPWGNGIELAFNLGFQEEFPPGISSTTAVITQPTGGSGVPDITDALAWLGTADTASANEVGITELVHGYGNDTTTLDAISEYNGEGNAAVGCWDALVARPFRSLIGDSTSDLSTLLTLGAGRKTDRTNGVLVIDGSVSNPQEVAAEALGIMARINNERAAQCYVGQILTTARPAAVADRWSSNYDSRDLMVKAGISPVDVQGGAVVLQNVCTFYHPDSIALQNNAYLSQRNISILQNIGYNARANFLQEKWQGISIVADLARVTNSTDKQKARDKDSVLDDLVALARSWEAKAWLYSADYTINKLKEADAVQIRSGGTGFTSKIYLYLSGEGNVLDNEFYVDTNISALLG